MDKQISSLNATGNFAQSLTPQSDENVHEDEYLRLMDTERDRPETEQRQLNHQESFAVGISSTIHN